MAGTLSAENQASIEDAEDTMTPSETSSAPELNDRTIIRQAVQGHFSKLRECLEGLRNCSPGPQATPDPVWAKHAETWEHCIKVDFRELRRQLPRAVREKVEELTRNERLDALYFRRPCLGAAGQEGVEEIFSKHVYDDPFQEVRRTGIYGLLRDPAWQAIWPEWSQVDQNLKAMFDEFDELAKVAPSAYALRPLFDDDAIDGLVRILVPLEEDIRARHKDKDERECFDGFDAQGLKGMMPANGAYWECICEAARDPWPNIPYSAIKQAMRQAIRRNLICSDRGDDFKFSDWVELPYIERGMGPVFSLTDEGKKRARQLGLLVDGAQPATPEITELFMTPEQLATKWHVNKEALDARLRRARQAKVKRILQFKDWNQKSTRMRNEPRYSYRESAVHFIIAQMVGRLTV